MAVYRLKTFADIYTAVAEAAGVSLPDTTNLNRIKREVNICYLDEVVAYEQWRWLKGESTLAIEPYLAVTCAVVANSNVVTLSQAVSPSKARYWFSVDGYDERYRIQAHTAGSTTLTLESLFGSSSNLAATGKIWTDRLPLSTDCRETIQVLHDFDTEPLDNIGMQKYNQLVAMNPKAQGVPKMYTTGEFVNPAPFSTIAGLPALTSRAASGVVKTLTFTSDVSSFLKEDDRIQISAAGHSSYNGQAKVSSVATNVVTYTGLITYQETSVADGTLTVTKSATFQDSARSREIYFYPALYTSRTALHVHYTKEVLPLENDADEPFMPVEDRSVLLFGTLALTLDRLGKPAAADKNAVKYGRKLEHMAGRLEDTTDLPVLRPSKYYLGAKRSVMRTKGSRNDFLIGGGAGSGTSSSTNVTGTPSRAARFDGTGLLTASPVLDSELGQLSGVLSPVRGNTDTATLTNKTINAINNTITNLTNASLNGSAGITYANLSIANSIQNSDIAAAAAIAYSKLVLTGSVVNADIATAAAIARSKIAAGTASQIVSNDGSGNLISVAQVPVANGGTGAATLGAHGVLVGEGAGNIVAVAAGNSGQVLMSNGAADPSMQTLPGNTTIVKAPTVQKFTSGSGTYTTPTSPSPLYLRVRLVGGGGGGAGSGTVSAVSGGAGGNTTFGTSLLSGSGGNGGSAGASAGGVGGAASLGSGPVGVALQGGAGQGAGENLGVSGGIPPGGAGAASPFGGAGNGGGPSLAGTAAIVNSGSGGGGGGTNTVANNISGSGGGAGGFVDAIITSLLATYAYAVGAAGTAGTLGTNGFGGAAGGSGQIIVEEFYQ